jgi:hypothetical protein
MSDIVFGRWMSPSARACFECRISDVGFLGGDFFFKKREKFGVGRGLAVVSWDVGFLAKNKGGLVTNLGKMLVFGLKMRLP